MKFVKILTIAILAFFLTMTLVRATHTSSITMNPNAWAASTDADVSLTVNNQNGDNIVKLELSVPETGDQKPIYLIKDISTPAGWTYSTTNRINQSSPYKITWSTTGAGIESGKSLGFGFTAQSPATGSYKWTWTTTDSKTGTYTGTLTTSIALAPVSYFTIEGVPNTTDAGESFKITVKVYDKSDKIKTDYTGTIKFTSTDYKAILPSDYTFKTSDSGLKEFSIMYKTVGDQTFTISDGTISKTSKITSVNIGNPVSITISPDNANISVGDKTEFKAQAKDKFGNKFDVTEKTIWDIDDQAGGNWSKNVYTSEKKGIWTVTGTYRSLVDGVTLNVGIAPVTPLAPTPVTPLTPLVIISEESITIAPGTNDTMTLTVNNMGKSDLTGVSLSSEGIPSDWILIYPPSIDIPAGTSKDFIVLISVPGNETESKTITFKATSQSGATTSKSVTLSIGIAPTGVFTAISKNLLQLGVVIIAVVAVVIIAWELWFRKPKKS